MSKDYTTEYAWRIGAVQDYIEKHLEEPLSLEALAGVAHFSPYHFHRLFAAFTGETLFQYIQRLRLEKAIFWLLAQPHLDITEVALRCGFANSSSFAKAFKAYYGVPASKIKDSPIQLNESLPISKSNLRQVLEKGSCYNPDRSQAVAREKEASLLDYWVEVKEIQPIEVVYRRHIGAYKGNAALFSQLFEELNKEVKALALPCTSQTRWLILCHNIPGITEKEKLILSICMTVEGSLPHTGNLGHRWIEGGKYGIGHFQLAKDQYPLAWNLMFSEWLPKSGYQPDDRPCFECYGEDKGEAVEEVAIYIPLEPLK